MKSFIRTALVTGLLLASGKAFGAQLSIGITIGPPPPPRVIRIVPQPPSPEFVWIGGYWYVSKKHYTWHEGYWTRPPYQAARWVAPYHDGKMFFDGYWEGERGRIEHDHHSDHDRDRDFHNQGRGRGHDR
jgi:hypothetical protein